MRIDELSLLCVNFLCAGLNKQLGLKLLHAVQYPRYCTGCESQTHHHIFRVTFTISRSQMSILLLLLFLFYLWTVWMEGKMKESRVE